MEWAEDVEPNMELPEDLASNLAPPDGRLGKRVRKAREVFFAEYDDIDKGIVSGFTNPGSPCSLNLLAAMKFNLRKMDDFLLVGSAHMKKTSRYTSMAVPIVLNETQAEFKRLLQHPELFPDGAGQSFLNEMEFLLRTVLKHLSLLHAARQKRQSELQERIKEYRKRILPDYDESRTIWQQFLHYQAPGSGMPKDQMLEHGCTQMIPAACSLMSSNRRDEHEDFAHFLEEARKMLLPPREKHIAGRIPYEGYRRTVRFVPHPATSRRPAPKEPSALESTPSLGSLAIKYPELAMRETRHYVRPITWFAALNNDRKMTDTKEGAPR